MSLTFERPQGRLPLASGTSEMATFAVPKPLYSQVRDMLASQISSGQWAQGTALPNETVLAQSFGVYLSCDGAIQLQTTEMGQERVLDRDRCSDTVCAEGEHCELTEVQCFAAPCLPVPGCVAS